MGKEEKVKEQGGGGMEGGVGEEEKGEVEEVVEEGEEEVDEDRPVEAPHLLVCLIELQKCSIRTGRIPWLLIGRCRRAAEAP